MLACWMLLTAYGKIVRIDVMKKLYQKLIEYGVDMLTQVTPWNTEIRFWFTKDLDHSEPVLIDMNNYEQYDGVLEHMLIEELRIFMQDYHRRHAK